MYVRGSWAVGTSIFLVQLYIIAFNKGMVFFYERRRVAIQRKKEKDRERGVMFYIRV